MSEIGTHRQVVDEARYGKGFDSTFQSKPGRPGKTVYVCREGQLVPKQSVDGFMYLEAMVRKAGEIDRNMRQWEETIVRSLQIPERLLALKHTNQPCSMGVKG